MRQLSLAACILAGFALVPGVQAQDAAAPAAPQTLADSREAAVTPPSDPAPEAKPAPVAESAPVAEAKASKPTEGPPPGPPPPAASRTQAASSGESEAEEGPNRIQMILGAEMGPAFFEELTTLIPGGSEDLWRHLSTQWNTLEERFGFHPAKNIDTAALIGFGPIHKHLGGLAVVFKGRFDVDRIHQAIRSSDGVAGGPVEIVEEDGRTVYRTHKGASLRFMDSSTALFLNGKLDGRFFDLAGEGLPDPLDLAALRAHYGLEGTNLYLNVVVTPRQRRALAEAPGPLALLGPQAETLGIRVEDARVQIGATFLNEQTAVQIEGMLQGGIRLARARLSDVHSKLQSEGSEADFFELLSPARAGKTAVMENVSGWVEGVVLSRAGTSVILELDRTKIPWLRLNKLTWLVGVGVPGFQAVSRYRAMLARAMMQRNRAGPSKSPFRPMAPPAPPGGGIPIPQGK